MKKVSAGIALLLTLMLFAAACSSDDDGVDAPLGSEPTPAPDEGTSDMNEEIQRLWIGPDLVDCVGVGPQKCMLIRRAAEGQVEYFYDQIEGFTHHEGTTYVIDVAVIEVDNPPADASSLRYRLVETIEESNEPVSAGLDGSAWKLLGFRDGDLFDAVPDDVVITLEFAGDRVNGSAGCNNYMGTFTADGDALTFGPLAATKKLCPPEVMQFEDRFLPLISAVETADLAFDGTLVLAPPSGQTLVFAPGA